MPNSYTAQDCLRTYENLSAKLVMLILPILISACAPRLSNFSVANGEPGENTAASITVTKNQTVIRDVTLEIKSEGGNFTEAGDMSGSGSLYSGQTPALLSGNYEARVAVTYVPGFQVAEQTRHSNVVVFSRAFPAGTFDFDTGQLNGWTYSGVFLTADNFDHCPNAQLINHPYFFRANFGWPAPGLFGPGGSLQVLVSDTCYPDQASEVSNSVWEFNLTSPNLINNPDWQNINGVSFRMRTNLPFGVEAIALVVVEDEQGNEVLTTPTQAGQLDFTDIGNAWSIVSKTGFIQNRPVKRVVIRIFGTPETVQNVGEAANVWLDVVSPIP